MTIVLIISAIVAVIYIYTAIAYYYGFKSWLPVCGCTGSACSLKKTA